MENGAKIFKKIGKLESKQLSQKSRFHKSIKFSENKAVQ